MLKMLSQQLFMNHPISRSDKRQRMKPVKELSQDREKTWSWNCARRRKAQQVAVTPCSEGRRSKRGFMELNKRGCSASFRLSVKNCPKKITEAAIALKRQHRSFARFIYSNTPPQNTRKQCKTLKQRLMSRQQIL